MVRDIQDDITQKILQIEKNIEEENGRIKLNRMPARYFMFFFIIGGEDESCVILERKVKALLSNPDACGFLQIKKCMNRDNCGKKAEKVLKDAANNRIDVQDLNTIFLCPVIFAKNDLGKDILPALTEIDSFMNHSGHATIWQPTVIIEKDVSEYKNIYFTVSEIKRFITTMPEGKVNRCCLLSNTDEKGFAVPKESIMQTIAMMVVLQNVITQNAGDSQAIRLRTARSFTTEDGRHLFFTARNAAVTNPTRSLLLQRMCSAIDFFSQKNTENNIMSRIDYSFVSRIMNQYIPSLPHHAGKITLFPLYSVMSDNSLHNQLKKIKKEKYYEPLCGEKIRKAQIDKAKDMFLKNYFFENGSLENLKSLIQDKSIEREFLQHKMDCYTTIQMDVPATDKKKLCEFQGGDYEQARMDCERLINNCGWELLETVGKQLSHPDMIRSIEFVQELIESIKTCIQTRLRQLKDVETVLVVEQTERRTEFRDVQSSWFEDAVLNNPKEYSEFIKRFDAIIYRILQNNTVDSWNELLQVCYDAIRHTAYSNNDYLNRVGEECMTNAQRASEFAMVVENSWLYTLRFLNFDKTKDATCIIGDSRNCFCKKLRDRFNGTLFDFNGFDRIDVLHISGAFSPENILEWEQIESIGKGA